MPSAAVHTTGLAAAVARIAAAEATGAGRAWGEATAAAGGTAAERTVAGIARWGLGGRLGAGLRRLRRAIGDTVAWGLWLSVCVGDWYLGWASVP